MQKREFSAPRIEDVGAVAVLTRNGFSKGNDVGKGKSGMGMGGPTS